MASATAPASASRRSKDRAAGHDSDRGVSDIGVVDGVGQLVTAGRHREVHRQVEVHFEGLGPFFLLGQDPVDAGSPEPPELDPIASVSVAVDRGCR